MARVVSFALALALTTLAAGGPSVSATSLAAAFSAASDEFGVPVRVLMAVSYAETRWDDPTVRPSAVNGYGVMHLQDNPFNDGLRVAATALGTTPSALIASTAENIRGGAIRLRRGYVEAFPSDPTLASSADLNRWYVPVARYLASDELQPQRDFADRVYGILERGVAPRVVLGAALRLDPAPGLRSDRGVYEGVPNDVMLAGARGKAVRSPSAGKSAAISASFVEGGADQWLGTPNQEPGRNGMALSGVVIHTCEASVTSCLNALRTFGTQKSAHYVMRMSDGWRYQLVHRADTAWQCGFCTQSPFGSNWNYRTVGIEHEGFSSDPEAWYTSTVYSRSAWLTARACVDFGFACAQWNGIWGHDYAQPNNSDPGPGWDWARYNTCVGERVEFLQTGSWPPGGPTCP